MSIEIKLCSSDGHSLSAFFSAVPKKAKGSVIILHAIYGRTQHMSDICDRWAAAGYNAIAPALYDRIKPNLVFNYDKKGQNLGRISYGKLDENCILLDIDAAIKHFKPNNKIIISGFCTGGTWAWIGAAKLSFFASINFYGSHIPSKMDIKPRCPTILHYGDKDLVVPIHDVKKIKNTFPEFSVYVYPKAGHAFFNPEQENYNKSAADLAWERSRKFLDKLVAQK